MSKIKWELGVYSIEDDNWNREWWSEKADRVVFIEGRDVKMGPSGGGIGKYSDKEWRHFHEEQSALTKAYGLMVLIAHDEGADSVEIELTP